MNYVKARDFSYNIFSLRVGAHGQLNFNYRLKNIFLANNLNYMFFSLKMLSISE